MAVATTNRIAFRSCGFKLTGHLPKADQTTLEPHKTILEMRCARVPGLREPQAEVALRNTERLAY